jgi:hypothetical protein
LFTRDIVTITPPVITFPSPVPDEILPITYSYESATAGIITITTLNTIAIVNFDNTGSLTTTTMMQLSSGGNGDVLLGELFPTLVSPNNVVNTIRVTIPNGISVVPYLYENVSAYGQNPAGAGLNQIRNCSVYSPSEVGTSIIPDNFLFFSLFGLQSSFTYNDMIITPANTNVCGVGTNPILHYIDLWLPANRTLTSTIEIFEGSNLVPSATYRRDNITTGGATITVAGQPMLPVRIYASDIVSAQGVSQNYIRPFNNGTLQFRIRITVIINGFPRILPTRQQFPNMPIMTVNMSSTDNIISNNSGITSQITTNFTDITITNNTSYRFGFLPLGIINRNQAWIQIGTINILGGTLTQYTCSLENVVSSVGINNIGRFRIRATTRESDRYESVFIDSLEYSVTPPQTVTFTGTVNFETIYVTSSNQVVSNPVSGGFTVYRVTFTSAGSSYVINSISPSTPISFLIVGGGGGSGNFNRDSGQFALFPGGGGGGGFIEFSGTTNSNIPYSIYVGRGGIGNSFDSTGNGENSLLQLSSGTLTAVGGGRGGNHGTNLNGLDGGSGGGGDLRVFNVGEEIGRASCRERV